MRRVLAEWRPFLLHQQYLFIDRCYMKCSRFNHGKDICGRKLISPVCCGEHDIKDCLNKENIEQCRCINYNSYCKPQYRVAINHTAVSQYTQRRSTAVPINVPMKAVPRLVTDILTAYKTPDSGGKHTDLNTSGDSTTAKIIYSSGPPSRHGISIVGKKHNLNLTSTCEKFRKSVTLQNPQDRWSSSEKKQVNLPSVLAQGRGASKKATIVVPNRRISLLRENRSFPPILQKISPSESGLSGLQHSITPIHASGKQLHQSVTLETREGGISTDVKVRHCKPAHTYQNIQEGAIIQKKTANEGWSSLAKIQEATPSGLAQGLGTSRRIAILKPINRISLHRGNRPFPPIVEKVSSEAGPSSLQPSITPMYGSGEQLCQSINLEAHKGDISTAGELHDHKITSTLLKSLKSATDQKKTSQEGCSSSKKKHVRIPLVFAQGDGASRRIKIVVPKNKTSLLRGISSFPPIVEKGSSAKSRPLELQPSIKSIYSHNQIKYTPIFEQVSPPEANYEPISPPSEDVDDQGTSSQQLLEYTARGSNLLPKKIPHTPIFEQVSPPETIYEPISPPSDYVEDRGTSSQQSLEFPAKGSNLPESESYKAIFEQISPPETNYEPISPPSEKVADQGKSSQQLLEYTARGSNLLPKKIPHTPIFEQVSPPETIYEPISPPSDYVEDRGTSSQQSLEFPAKGSNLPESESYKAIFEQSSPPETNYEPISPPSEKVADQGTSSQQLLEYTAMGSNLLPKKIPHTPIFEQASPPETIYEPISPPSDYVEDRGTSSQQSLEFPAKGSNLPESESYKAIFEQSSPPETNYEPISPPSEDVDDQGTSSQQLLEYTARGSNILPKQRPHTPIFEQVSPPETIYEPISPPSDYVEYRGTSSQQSLEFLAKGSIVPENESYTPIFEQVSPIETKYEPISPPSENVEDQGKFSQPLLEYPAKGSNQLPKNISYTPIFELVSPPEMGPSELQISVTPTPFSEVQLFQAANLDTYKTNNSSVGIFHEYRPTTTDQNSLESGMKQINYGQEGRSSSIEKNEPIPPPSEKSEDQDATSQPALEFTSTESNLPENRSCTLIFEQASSPKAGPSGIQFSKSSAHVSPEQLNEADKFGSMLPEEDIQKEMLKYDDGFFDLLLNQEDQEIDIESFKTFQQSDGGEVLADLGMFITDYYASLTINESEPPTIQCSSAEMINPKTADAKLSTTAVNTPSMVVKPSTSAVNPSSFSVSSEDGGSSLSAGTTSKKRRRKQTLPPRRGSCLPGTYIQYRAFRSYDDKESALTTDQNTDRKDVEYKEEKPLASPSYDVPELDLFAQDDLSEAVSFLRNNQDDVNPKPKNENINNPEDIQESNRPKRGRPRTKKEQPPKPKKTTRGAFTPGAPRPPRGRTIRSIEGIRATRTDLSHLLGNMRLPAWKTTLPCGSKAYVGRGLPPFKIPPAPEIKKVCKESAALGNKIRQSHPSEKEDVFQDIVNWLMDNEEEKKYQQKSLEE